MSKGCGCCPDACRNHHFSIKYTPCRSDIVPSRVSKYAPIYFATTSSLRRVSTFKDFFTAIVRVRATLGLWSDLRQWSALASISLMDIGNINCGLGALVSGGVGFYIYINAWIIIYTGLFGPILSAIGKDHRLFRYPIWHWVGICRNNARRKKWPDAKFCGYWMPIVLENNYLSLLEKPT